MNAIRIPLRSLDRMRPPPPPLPAPFAAPLRVSLYDQIGRSIGERAADKLVADFGGRRLYIPMAPTPGELVTRSIGLVAARAMAREFGGDRILIPVTSMHERRRVRILAMRADRISISHIAHDLRCTERYVYKVLALHRAPGSALSAPPASSTPAPIAERFKRGTSSQPR
jgi:hypothetical protein